MEEMIRLRLLLDPCLHGDFLLLLILRHYIRSNNLPMRHAFNHSAARRWKRSFSFLWRPGDFLSLIHRDIIDYCVQVKELHFILVKMCNHL